MIIPAAPIKILQEAFKNKVPTNPYETKIVKAALERRGQRNNPYDSKIPQGETRDSPIVRDTDYNLLGNSLGNSVYSNVTFLGGSYTDNQGRTINFPRVDFEAILTSLTFPRVIVKTEIQGKDGTVKEYIGEGDPQINFTGIICGAPGRYPIDEVNQLKQIIKAPIAISVVSVFLQNLDIHSIVFEDRDFAQEEGGYSYQKFSLNAIGDIPQELRIEGV